MARACWLVKSEPGVYSFDDLLAEDDRTTCWDGVRNYQARNFMRQMKVGDTVLFYHSSTTPPHLAGVAEVVREAYPDPTAWEAGHPHFDPRSTPDEPRWLMVDVRAVRPLPRPIPLDEMRANPTLAGMRLLQRGQRLSVMPVTAGELDEVLRMAASPAPAGG